MKKFRALCELDDTQGGSVQLVEGISGPHLHAGNTDIVLIPQPSEDPLDPLRWPRWKKLFPFILVNFFAFMVSWVIGGLSQAFFVLSKELDQPITKIAGLLSYCILTLGLGNIFWVPMALFFGKRPTFVVASLVFFVGCIWSSVSQSYQSLLASRIVTAFAGGSTEALGAAIINDLFFLHERGRMMGWCVILLSSGNSLGPLCAGFMVSALGWRWFYWLCTIVCGVLFLAIVFCFPETRFERHVLETSSSSSLPGGQEEDQQDVKRLETTTPVALDAEHVEIFGGSATAPVSTTPKKTTSMMTTSYLQMLKLWSSTPTNENILTVVIRPFPTLAYPAVMWAIVGYSISLACVVTVNSLNSFVLQAPPYKFSPAINGLVNVPALMGTLFGSFTGGHLTDAYSTWDARRHGGMFRPESRLPLLVIPGIFVPTGLFMFGYGATQQWHWAILFVANGFINVGITAVASIAMVYVSDSYFPVAHEALLVINGLKNVVAFGYSYGVTPWIVRDGFEKPFATLAGLFWAMMLISVGFYIFGEKIRSSSSKWKVIYS